MDRERSSSNLILLSCKMSSLSGQKPNTFLRGTDYNGCLKFCFLLKMFFQLLLSVEHSIEQHQRKCIRRVFRDFHDELKRVVAIRSPPQDYIFSEKSEKGIRQCSLSFGNGILERFTMYRWDFYVQPGKLHLEWLPQTVRRLEVQQCNQKFTLRLHWMPRECRTMNLRKNYIYGSVPLTYLPRKSVHVDFSDNRLSGKVIFVNLPNSLVRLFLHRNWSLGREKVFYGDFSENLEVINVKKTNMRRFEPLWGEGTANVHRVFQF